jgi:hypothetical protein
VGVPLVGNWSETTNWPKTGRLASVGLNQDLLSSLSSIFALTLSILTFTLSMVLGCLVFLGESRRQRGLNPGPRQQI